MALVSLRNADQLGWIQPSWFSRTIEVTSSDALAAILRLQTWGRTCDATTADGMWRFAIQGFFGRAVSITAIPTGHPVGTFVWQFRRGILRLETGDVYEWKRLGFWSGERAFVTPSGFPVTTFRPKMFSFKSRGEVRIHREYSGVPELPLLATLGINLVTIEQRRRK